MTNALKNVNIFDKSFKIFGENERVVFVKRRIMNDESWKSIALQAPFDVQLMQTSWKMSIMQSHKFFRSIGENFKVIGGEKTTEEKWSHSWKPVSEWTRA